MTHNLNLYSTISELSHNLKSEGCSLCDLSSQDNINGIVVYRGDPSSRRMIIGEAPGAREDECGRPFSGPAGKKADEIFASVGLDTDTDFYISNIIKCRPVAPHGSGRQNLTPQVRHRQACRPYIVREIELIRPTVIVLQGLSAVKSLLPEFASYRMGDIAGRFLTSNEFPNIQLFPMYHAAALLHAQGTESYRHLRRATWEHIQRLKEWIDTSERR